MRFLFRVHFFYTVYCIMNLFIFQPKGEGMADIDVKQLVDRIDTVLDILVAGDYQSAIRNLEILKAELHDLNNNDNVFSIAPKTPWEI